MKKYLKVILCLILLINIGINVEACNTNHSSFGKRNEINHNIGKKHKKIKIYPVKVTNIISIGKGHFIIKGKTIAPDGAKIMGQAVDKGVDNTDSDAYKVGSDDD